MNENQNKKYGMDSGLDTFGDDSIQELAQILGFKPKDDVGTERKFVAKLLSFVTPVNPNKEEGISKEEADVINAGNEDWLDANKDVLQDVLLKIFEKYGDLYEANELVGLILYAVRGVFSDPDFKL